MEQTKLHGILKKHKMWLNEESGGEKADLRGADLRGADLSDADLRGADLRGADLSSAYLSRTDLSRTDLRGADLSDANIDYSCWPIWCGGLHVHIDRRIAAQLAYHFCNQECDDPDYLAARNAILDFANSFHRVQGCGKLEPIMEDEQR